MPRSCDAARLTEQSDQYMESLYPAESNHLESPEALQKPNVSFFGAYVGEDLVGCGAVKVLSDDGSYGEIKRVFVLRDHRGEGIAEAIMEHLESHLGSLGIDIARLEVGTKQPEALKLYAKLGYIEREPFGQYAPDPLSVFMERQLGV